MSLSIIKYPSGGGGGGTDMAIGGMVLGGTEGSVLFIGTAGVLAEDNPNFFYDNTNNAFALGHNAPDARFHIHDVVFDNYLTITRPDTVVASDPGAAPVTVRYNLTQTDGNWAGDAVTGQGLRLESISTYNGVAPVPGLFQVAMPTHINADPANFDTALNVTGFIGANISGDDTGINVSSNQAGINITAPSAINFANVNVGLSSQIGNLTSLFSITCDDGGIITATAGTGLTLEGYGGPGLQAASYVVAQPSILGLKLSSTGTTIDPVATFRATTNFVVQNNSGLYLNLQPALPASQISDALRMTAKWTNIASPTSEIQFAGRNANVDTQILTIQSNANGRVGIGSTVTAPTARLHLPAGSATAQTAPLKFTSGTNLTTGEAGAVEYNGTNLFFTRTGTTRETIVTASAVTTEIVVSDTTITVNINGTNYKLLAVPA